MIIQVLKANYANLYYILSLFLIILTLFVLLGYAADTRRIADQAQESNLRPVILRSGSIPSLEHLIDDTTQHANSPRYLEFMILKNIAKDINGYIIIKHSKYQLLFSFDIPKVGQNTTQSVGWMKADTHLYAWFNKDDRQQINEEDRIYLSYKDIEGNSYCTIEDKNLRQEASKLK